MVRLVKHSCTQYSDIYTAAFVTDGMSRHAVTIIVGYKNTDLSQDVVHLEFFACNLILLIVRVKLNDHYLVILH